MLEGGLVARRPYLVVGPSGTGKTTLALQFLCEGIRRGERALLVTLEEPPNEARINHRGFEPELDQVEVFDAIPDIMRYERVPFKDIASVRSAQPFSDVSLVIRRSPELSAVEVTMAALEQMLRTEVIRRGYSRIAIDSLTALQYFCMKGFDLVAGAQSFLRFLSDLRVTTILTVESPLEDVETPERAMARGEIRLFRWELENRSVRAIGVEKFRGSPHDVRLHPYRIGSKGIGIDLQTTISRDTRQIIEPGRPVEPIPAPTPIPLEEVISPVDSLAEEVRDLVLVGAEIGPVRTEIEAALGAAAAGELDRSRGHISRATALAIGLSDSFRQSMSDSTPHPTDVTAAFQRINQRAEAARAGLPPTRLPPPKVLEIQLEWVLSLLPPSVAPSVPEVPPGAVAVLEGPGPVPVTPSPTSSVSPVEFTASAPGPTVPAAPVPGPSIVAAVAAVEPRSKLEEAANLRPEPAPLPSATSHTLVPSDTEPRAALPVGLPPVIHPSTTPLHDVSTPGTRIAPPALPTRRSTATRPSLAAKPAAIVGALPARGASHTSRAEERPPLPHAPARIPTHEKSAPPREARPAEVARHALVLAVTTQPHPTPTVPAPPLSQGPPTAATAIAKRRRKTSTASRRKLAPTEPGTVPPSSAPGSPMTSTNVAPREGDETTPVLPAPTPEAAGPGPIPTTKPRKRTARKRKAPPVVAATAGTIPPSTSGGPTAAAPPSESAITPKEGE